MFTKDYADVFAGDARWQSLPTPEGQTFTWDPESTYVRKPPYFEGMTAQPTPVANISGARVLALVGDSVTTDHISPAGAIKADSPYVDVGRCRWATSTYSRREISRAEPNVPTTGASHAPLIVGARWPKSAVLAGFGGVDFLTPLSLE
jgi:hypothetical protein